VGTAAADAPPTIENVNPAAPRTGTDFGIRFFFEACFTRGISHSSIPWKKWFESSNGNSTPGKSAMQDRSHGSIEAWSLRQRTRFILMNEFGAFIQLLFMKWRIHDTTAPKRESGAPLAS
jgi:hypothetical protein